MRRLGLLLVIAALALPASAAASSGAFTKAIATPDWSHGSFAGSATWTECTTNCASWQALIEVQPTTYPCTASEWHEPSPNIKTVWGSGAEPANATIPFEVNDAELLQGVYGQRLCLIGVQSYVENYPPSSELLTYAVMQVETTAPSPTPTPSPAPTPIPTPGSSGPSTRCTIAGKEVKRLETKLKLALRGDASLKRLKVDRKVLAKAKARELIDC